MVAKTASLWDRFAAADPGLLRLAAGLRAVLGLTLTLAALTVRDQSPVVLLAGGFTAVVTSLASSDPHPRNQFRTLLAGAPVTLAALSVGGLLAPFPLASHLAFLLLIFTAVYARRFGRRGLDLGIFAFMAYFLSQFARIQPHQLPQLTAASAVAFAAAAITRLCLVPTTSHQILRRLRAAFNRRLRDAQQATSDLLADGGAGVRRVERRLDRLHACALLLQEFLDEAPVGLLPDTAAELERTARADAIAQRLGVLAIRAAEDSTGTSGGTMREVETGDSTDRTERDRVPLRPGAVRPAGPSRHTTRQALQVTAAAALAVAGGHLLSPHLWYWAVATAWVVFINAEHTGDVLLQSGRRLIGTVAGVPFGYGLAVLTDGHSTSALALLLGCVFGMFYIPSGSYWAVTFFITGSLSMVLAVLHTFSPQLLALRVQETALGAGCGILAAALVVPMTVRTVAEMRLRELLLLLDHYVRCAPQAGVPKPAPDARDLDRALEAFRAACRPLVHPLNPRRAERARVRRVLERVEATSFHARSLATETGRARDAAARPASSHPSTTRRERTNRALLPPRPCTPSPCTARLDG
ncbi:FUSC family protein [Embleya scabrispora]|uniref:FUSC family protein n=1 Tax=Embleya scabrispora TaxID=159449 RepID=UPI0003607A3C|nr:FUSC family protein [Embleya scabrispora]MYS80575.1 FUSC family protein [Streptomyces sp. SID5474]